MKVWSRPFLLSSLGSFGFFFFVSFFLSFFFPLPNGQLRAAITSRPIGPRANGGRGKRKKENENENPLTKLENQTHERKEKLGKTR